MCWTAKEPYGWGRKGCLKWRVVAEDEMHMIGGVEREMEGGKKCTWKIKLMICYFWCSMEVAKENMEPQRPHLMSASLYTLKHNLNLSQSFFPILSAGRSPTGTTVYLKGNIVASGVAWQIDRIRHIPSVPLIALASALFPRCLALPPPPRDHAPRSHLWPLGSLSNHGAGDNAQFTLSIWEKTTSTPNVCPQLVLKQSPSTNGFSSLPSDLRVYSRDLLVRSTLTTKTIQLIRYVWLRHRLTSVWSFEPLDHLYT